MKKQRRFIWNNLFSLGTNYCQLQKRKQQLLTNHSLWFSLKTRHLIVTLVNSVLSPEDQNPGEAQPDQQDNPTVANTWKKYRSFVFHIFLSHSKFYIWPFIFFIVDISLTTRIIFGSFSSSSLQEILNLVRCYIRLSSCRCNTQRGCCKSPIDGCSTWNCSS